MRRALLRRADTFRGQRTSCHAALLVAVSCLLLSGNSPAQEPAFHQESEAIERILLAASDDAALLEELSALPPAELGPTLTRLSLAGGPDCPWPAITGQRIARSIHDLPYRVRRILVEKQPALADERRQAIADVGLSIIGLGDHPDQLSLAIDIYEQAALPRTKARHLQARLAKSAQMILSGNASAYGTLRRYFEVRTLPVRMALITALTEVATPESYQLLPRLLGKDRRLDAVILSRITHLHGARLGRIDAIGLRRIRESLTSASPMTCKQAILAVGTLDDHEAVHILIDNLLLDADLQADAGWALRKLTGMGFRNDPTRWSNWYDNEVQWWRRQAPHRMRDLRGSIPRLLVPSIQELARHRLYRDELATALLHLLDHPTPAVVKITCAALRRLGSDMAIEPLEALVLDCPPENLNCVQDTLANLTHQDPK